METARSRRVNTSLVRDCLRGHDFRSFHTQQVNAAMVAARNNRVAIQAPGAGTEGLGPVGAQSAAARYLPDSKSLIVRDRSEILPVGREAASRDGVFVTIECYVRPQPGEVAKLQRMRPFIADANAPAGHTFSIVGHRKFPWQKIAGWRASGLEGGTTQID